MRVAVLGLGAVGARAARQLASTDGVTEVVLRDPDAARVDEVAASLGVAARAEQPPYHSMVDADAAVLASPGGRHGEIAMELVAKDTPVVSCSDAINDVEALLELGPEAEARNITVVVGAAFAPGLTCVLARLAGQGMAKVDEVHVARVGTGGPSCARHHHRSLGGVGIDWRDGGWVRRPAGSGRELCWFPEPIGAEDCYRAALPDALLLVPAFPGVGRVTARLAANRRDRLTARMPMLRPPHPEGGLGAVRTEVRGERDQGRSVQVLGAMDRPAVAAGAVAALSAVWAAEGRLRRHGAGGLASLVEPRPFLEDLARRGVKVAVFEGG
jgi:saccharopine dehydrogenase-like NADP-dependent oxidoreductase